jgi:hypothetical protein
MTGEMSGWLIWTAVSGSVAAFWVLLAVFSWIIKSIGSVQPFCRGFGWQMDMLLSYTKYRLNHDLQEGACC